MRKGEGGLDGMTLRSAYWSAGGELAGVFTKVGADAEGTGD
jgi:hypothetical protein